MKISFYFLFALFILSNTVGYAQNNYPNTHKKGWKSLFGKNLETAQFDPAIWKDSTGVLTASKDSAIWSKDMYDDFILDLDFQNADGTNSGVIDTPFSGNTNCR